MQGDLSRVSRVRDGYMPMSAGAVPRSYDDVLDLINRSNHTAVTAMRGYSSAVLLGLTEWAGEQLNGVWEILDPHGIAQYAVAWAGEE